MKKPAIHNFTSLHDGYNWFIFLPFWKRWALKIIHYPYWPFRINGKQLVDVKCRQLSSNEGLIL
jgi:hypothetical protein